MIQTALLILAWLLVGACAALALSLLAFWASIFH